jgi:para-nitrobenzyl esterase
MGSKVKTRAGRLEGEDLGAVQVFRGIPYAEPPVGELRLRPPQPPKPWKGVRSALEFGPSAPQTAAVVAPLTLLYRRLIGAPLRRQSQDCLYLNVWTPQADDRRRPVMVWIHGGAFMMGSGATPLYDGTHFARRGDVVVVTLNYRLGALGFLNLRQLRSDDEMAPSNVGLRDQIAALEWVRDNIEAFGGDPENVTVFGESAGAMSVGTLLGTPRAQGLFHRAILQSGAADHVSSQHHATHVAEAFLSELRADARDAGALHRARVSEILRAERGAALRLALRWGSLPWQPSVDSDLLPEHPHGPIERGLAKGVPVLVGTNRDEWRLFMMGDVKGRRLDEAGLARRLERALPGANASGVPLSRLALEHYQELRPAGQRLSPTEIWVAFQSDRIFHYPARRLAALHSTHTARTYTYLFNWSGPFPLSRLGACHGIEIPFVFGTLRNPLLRPVLGVSRSARDLSRVMQDAWIAFARTGQPEHEGLPEWPAYETERRATMLLGPECFVAEKPFGRAHRFWNDHSDSIDRAEAHAGAVRIEPPPGSDPRRGAPPAEPPSGAPAGAG